MTASEIKYGQILRPDDGTREQKVRRGFWRTLKRAARSIPFAEELVAGYYCAIDPSTPARVRALLLAALAYFVLPFDVIPDFVAAVGFTDDASVLIGTLAMVRAHIGPAHRDAARHALGAGNAA